MEVYFSADVETDGPIPGPYSMLSFAIVLAGYYDGEEFIRPSNYNTSFYRELKPISESFQEEALQVNGLDRDDLIINGADPSLVMEDAYSWVLNVSKVASPVFVAYPLSFDWSWLYWYFYKFSEKGSPFGYSQCYDIKTAVAVKSGMMISEASRSRLPNYLLPNRPHTHHALDDAIEQAEIFANVFEWGTNEPIRRAK